LLVYFYMQIKQKIEYLVLAYDSAALGVKKNFPTFLVDFKLTLSTLEKYQPTFLERCSFAAWDLCYLAYVNKNPGGSAEDFRKKYVGTIPGHKAYQLALVEVQERLPVAIELDSLKEFQNRLREGLEASS